MRWDIIDTGLGSPAFNMAFDRSFVVQHRTIHLYLWDRPCISYGYCLSPARYLNLEVLQKLNITLIRRPTGGGIVFHQYDYAFSLLIPREDPWYSLPCLTLYREIHRRLVYVFQPLLPSLYLTEEERARKGVFCMGEPVLFDLMRGNKKFVGAALRQQKMGVIYQGMIGLAPLNSSMQEVFLHPEDREAYATYSGRLCHDSELDTMRRQLKEYLIQGKHFLDESVFAGI